MTQTRLLHDTDPKIYGASTALVVIVHGLTGQNRGDWYDAVREFLPDADLLVPEYASGVFSNTDPRRVAEQLAQYIHEADLNRSRRSDNQAYEHIILVGHSGGGLIVRKTYLIAMGYGNDDAMINNPQTLPWATKVERIVLLAAINRGISDAKPKYLSWPMYMLQQLGWAIVPWLGLGRLLLNLRRGSPFVANLRVQWIRLGYAPNVDLPVTIQLLGDIDEVVAADDSIDILTDANFRYLKVRDTGHSSICDFQASEVGLHRKEKFRQALVTPLDQLDGNTVPNQNEVGQEQDHIVFVMHGIRDMGLWTEKISRAVESLGQDLGQSVNAITAGYGYFPMIRFLFLGARQDNVRWFMDRYTEAIARYPKAKVSFIGHSNGTYLLASALQRYRTCRLNHVAFAGSVVPIDYPWDELVRQGRITSIRNDIASADWIVGIFPGFFELLNLGDIGTAGHNGFQDDAPKHSSFTRYFRGNHGAALQPQNHKSLATYILTGKTVAPGDGLLVERQDGRVVMLAKLCWLVWSLIVVVAGLLGVLITWLLSTVGIPLLLGWLIYIGLVLLLMYTL